MFLTSHFSSENVHKGSNESCMFCVNSELDRDKWNQRKKARRFGLVERFRACQWQDVTRVECVHICLTATPAWRHSNCESRSECWQFTFTFIQTDNNTVNYFMTIFLLYAVPSMHSIKINSVISSKMSPLFTVFRKMI